MKVFLLQQRIELVHSIEDENGLYRCSVTPRMLSADVQSQALNSLACLYPFQEWKLMRKKTGDYAVKSRLLRIWI